MDITAGNRQFSAVRDNKDMLYNINDFYSLGLGEPIPTSGEHGIGYAKKTYLHQQIGENQVLLMQGIKKVFDPKNILNPGKVCQ